MIARFEDLHPSPYGAPELKRVAKKHLMNALLTASALWLAVLTIAIAVGIGPAPLEIHMPTVSIDLPHAIDRLQDPPAASRPAAARPRPSTDGKVDPAAMVPPPPPADFGEATAINAPPDDHAVPVIRITEGVGPIPTGIDRDSVAVYVEVLPDPIETVKPEYPELPLSAGVEGTVVVKALVGRDGRVREAAIAPNGSIPMLDGAALEAAKKWRFHPALVNGRPVAVWIAIPIRFTLHPAR